MPRILNKIKNPQEDISSFNVNFDRISLDLSDRSGTFSTVGIVSGLVVPAGEGRTVEVSVVDVLEIYTKNKMPVIPRVDVYVGTDNDDDYLWPSGASVTNAQVYDISVSVYQARHVFNEQTNEKGTYFIHIKNRGASPYTLYIYADVYYVPAPDEGVAKRATNA